MLVEFDSEMYRKHVAFENGKKLIYVVLLREMHGMIEVALLFYKRFCGDLENIGYEFNPYNPCVANRITVWKQQTVRFHVDDAMPSHVNPKINYKFKEWTNRNYGKHGKVKANRRKVHNYLGMNFDFTEEAKVKINMDDYVERMINYYPIKLNNNDMALTPSGNNFFL